MKSSHKRHFWLAFVSSWPVWFMSGTDSEILNPQFPWIHMSDTYVSNLTLLYHVWLKKIHAKSRQAQNLKFCTEQMIFETKLNDITTSRSAQGRRSLLLLPGKIELSLVSVWMRKPFFNPVWELQTPKECSLLCYIEEIRSYLKGIKFRGYLISRLEKIIFCGHLISWFGDCKTFHGYLISRFLKLYAGITFFQQKLHCVFVEVSERSALLSRHKIDVKEDIVTWCEQEQRH